MVESIRLLTWNLNGLDDDRLDERTEAALMLSLLGVTTEELIAGKSPRATPTIICYQEVTHHTFKTHIVRHLNHANFSVIVDRSTQRGYFEIIAVHESWSVDNVNSFLLPFTDQNRCCTEVMIQKHNHQLNVLTAHFESLKSAKTIRIQQARAVIERMREYKRSVFAGDTNLRHDEWKKIDKVGIVDAWEQSGSDSKLQWTWYAQQEAKARFDRVWTCGGVSVDGYQLVSYGDVRAGFPSDHLGVEVLLSVLA